MKHDLSTKHLEHIIPITEEDGKGLHIAEQQQYKGSWKRRGGIGAYMMLCRKWDRLENQIESTKNGATQFDIFDHIAKDERAEGLIDDIRDLRRYLTLVEAEMRARGSASATSTHRDNKDDGTPDECYPSDHIPDGDCTCHACRAMKELAEPHLEGCQCDTCLAKKAGIDKDHLTCRCPGCEQARAKWRLDKHPVDCMCPACQIGRGHERLTEAINDHKEQEDRDNSSQHPEDTSL